MINPWLNKVLGRGFQDPEESRDIASGTLDFAKRAGSLFPLGIGVGIGLSRLKSNNPLNITGVGVNQLTDTARTVGDNIRALTSIKQAAAEKGGQKFAEALFRGQEFERIAAQGGDKLKALLSTMSGMIDETRLPDVTNLKNRWIELIDEVDNIKQDDIRRMKEAAATMFETMGAGDKQKFKSLFTTYEGIAPQLQAPLANIKGMGEVFNPISDARGVFRKELKGRPLASKLFEEVQATFGAGRVQFGSISEGAAGPSYYARVGFGQGRNVDYLNIPINLARIKGQAPIFRSGSTMSTTYLGRQHYMDAPAVQNEFITGSGKLNKKLIQGQLGTLGGAFMSIEETFWKEVQRTVRTRGNANLLGRDRRDIYQYFRDLGIGMERGTRPGLLKHLSPAMSGHLQAQALRQSASVGITGMELLSPQEQARFTATLGSMKGPYGGAGAEITRRPDNRAFGQISFLGGNAPEDLVRDLGGGRSPVLLPETARARQMIGRSERFTGGGTVNSTLGRGKAINMYGTNLGFAAANMGGINTAVIMDLEGGTQRLGISEGMAYWGVKPDVQTQFTKTILNPAEQGLASTKLLNELIRRRESGAGPMIVEGNKNIREFFARYSAPGKAGAAILGQLDDRIIDIPRYTGLKSLAFELVEETMGMGRSRYHVAGYMTRRFTDDKVFSMLGKVTTAGMDKNMFQNLLNRMGGKGLQQTIGQIGLFAGGTMINPGAMLTKAPHYVASQMISGVGLVADPGALTGGMEGFYEQMQKQVSKGLGAGFGGLTAKGQEASFLRETISAVGGQLGRMKGVTSEMAGLVFGGVRSEGVMKEFGLTKDTVERAISESIKGSHLDTEAVLRQAKRGVAIGATTAVAGTPSTTYRSTLASMEPRYFQMLSHKLQNVLGLPSNVTSDFLSGLLARKATTGQELQVITSLAKSMEVMGGVTGLGQGSGHFYKNLPRVSVVDFISAGVDTDTTKQFLSKYKSGFMLDLGGTGPVADLSKQFSGAKEIFIGGGDVVGGLKGAVIKQAGRDINIQHEYVRRVNEFAKDISVLGSAQGLSGTEVSKLQEAAGGFRYQMSQIFGQTWKTLLSGKLRGSTQVIGAGFSLAGPNLFAGITRGQAGKMEAVFKRAEGQAVFATGQAFLDSMRSYMGGATDELLALGKADTIGAARRMAKTETTSMFEAFFLGMEGRAGQARGAEGIISRHPLLSPGHINIMSVFRHDFAASGGDNIFKAWTGTAKGGVALKELASALAPTGRTSLEALQRGGFAELNRAIGSNPSRMIKEAKGRFFGLMSENISSFAGEGGGKIFFPNMEIDVHFTGKNKVWKLNLSKAAAMIGDFDGDFYGLHIVSKKRGLMQQDAARKLLASTELAYGMQFQMFMEEGSAGLKELATSLNAGKLTPQQFAFESLQKEFYGKQIGSVDVALDSLRLGMIQGAQTAEEKVLAQQGLGLMAMLEEVVIKSKKLPKALPFAEKTTLALNQLIQSKGENIAALDWMMKQVFKGSDLVGQEGFDFDWGKVKKSVARGVPGTKMQGQVMDALRKLEKVNLDKLMKYTQKSAEIVNSIGLDRLKTIGRSGAMAGMQTDQMKSYWQFMLQDAQSLRGALMAGEEKEFASETASLFRDVQRRASGVTGKFSSRMIGPIGVGMAATLGMGAMLGDRGFSAQPLIQPGEISDHRVNAAIASGSFYDQERNPQAPENLMSPAHMNIMGRPLEPSTAYSSRRNAWQIRGEATSMDGMMGVTNLLSSMGASSSVRINDARMPITPSYIDRLLSD